MTELIVRFYNHIDLKTLTIKEKDEFGDGKSVRLPCNQDVANNYIYRVGYANFLQAYNRHPELRSLFPETCNLQISFCFGREGFIYHKDSVGHNLLDLEVRLGTSVEEILATPIVGETFNALAEESAKLALENIKRKKEKAIIDRERQEAARRKAAEMLNGAIFEKIEGKTVFLKSSDGRLIKVDSTHSVWEYGDCSKDNVIVTGHSEVVFLEDDNDEEEDD
jgi:hypothetical protein